MNANEAMLIVAAQLAEEYGYTKVSEETLYAKDDSFWGNRMAGMENPDLKIMTAVYEMDEWAGDKENERPPRIKIDMNWSNPRLNVDAPNKDFACITFDKDTGKAKDCQAFNEGGITLLTEIYSRISRLIKHQ